ncbi:MAG: hypothetical protein C0594_00655 [Marinilabiliales bacterium]|nr:MAG: hypothetical protein C0594_00655 [Marinilabiliales bacterium]
MDNSIVLAGIILSEPVTFLTDVLVSVFCAYFIFRLLKAYPNTRKNWRLFYLFMGISSFVGGVAHLLFMYTGYSLKMVSWCFIGLSVFFAEIASIRLVKGEKVAKMLKILAYFKLAVYMFAVFYTMSFIAAKVNLAVGLIGIVSTIQISVYFRCKKFPHFLIALGFIFAISLVFIHGFKLSFHTFFNHNDISHIVTIICLYISFLGIIKAELPNHSVAGHV